MIALFVSAGPLTGTAVAAPTYSVAPSVSDAAFVGTTLAVTRADWPAGTSITDEWFQCGGTGNTCVDTSVSGPSYTVRSSDSGKVLVVHETGSDVSGSTTIYSNQTPPVTTVAQSSLTPPTIPSTASVQRGQVLTENHGSSSPASNAYTYQWKRCDFTGSQCTNISGANASTYTATVADEGSSLEIQETPSSMGVGQVATSSAPTAVVRALPPAISGSGPTISGTTIQGQTLTASPGTWTNNPTSYNYQWQDCDSGGQNCTAISGAKAATYTLTAGDVGDTIVVSVSGVNPDGAGAAVTSAATARVQTASTVSLAAAPTAPVTNQSVTVAATVTSRAAAGTPSGTVTLSDRGKPISGCAGVPVAPSGQSVTALCQTSFGAGSPQLTATFTPAAGSVVLGSSSSEQRITVGKDTATTVLDASAQVQINATTTYTATVAPSAARSGPIQPSGDVQFLDGGKPIPGCTLRPVVSGGATCTIKYSATGRQSIVAQYLGDANFVGSSSSAKAVNVTALAARRTITATMQWTFAYAPSYTQVLTMVINGVPVGATVEMQCHGRGCPFVKRTSVIAKPHCKAKAKRKHKRSCPFSSRVNLTNRFHGRNLRPGAQITIQIRRPQFVGKYYSFTMRSRKQPRVRIGCLAVNGSRPNVGC